MDELIIIEKCQAFIKSLQALREKKGLTLQELGDRAGLKAANIHKIESGVYKPNLETIMRIADALEVDLILRPGSGRSFSPRRSDDFSLRLQNAIETANMNNGVSADKIWMEELKIFNPSKRETD